MRAFKKAMKKVYGWIAAAVLIPWRYSMRYESLGSLPLVSPGKGFAVAFLHAHQLPGIFGVELPNSWVMVSRSADGDLLLPTLGLRGIRVARGSSQKGGKDKGGREALTVLVEEVQKGAIGFLAVDGPQGPRGKAKRGIATLALTAEVPIYPVVIIPARRWILEKAWDRMQLPKPFTKIRMHWGEPIQPAGRTTDAVREDVNAALAKLEAEHDPEEAARCAQLASP